MKNREYIMIVVIFLLAFFFFRKCSEEKSVIQNTELNEKLRPDTVYLAGKEIPVPFPVPVIEYRDLIPDSIVSVELSDNMDLGIMDTVRTYLTSFDDSLISGTIKSRVMGTLLSSSLDFEPKFPQYIERVDTIRITKPVAVDVPKWGLYGGAIIGGSSMMFNFQPAILIKTNKDLQFSIGYDLIHKTYNVGLFTKIKNPFKR
jgi:hypothetical protein